MIKFFHVLKYGSLLGLMAMGISLYAQQKERIPVIVIMADQLRPDALGTFTPNINALKKDAVTFNRAYCAVPLCAPSRASFFTGLYASHTGSLINPFEKEDEVFGETKAGIPNMYGLMESDWDSHHVGKQHFFTQENIDKSANSKTKWITQEDYTAWIKSQNKTKPGGKQYKNVAPEIVSGTHTQLRSYSVPGLGVYKEGPAYFLDHYIANESIAAIRNRDKTKPLLLNAMFLAPHPPFSIPEPYFSMVRTQDFSLPENVGQWYPGQSPLQMYNLTGFIGSRYTREQWSEIWAKYLGLVKLLDDEVGRVINVLKEEGLYDKALILFTSDHGEMLGSHSLWQKMCMYEESARVPFIMKLPSNLKTNITTSDQLISLVDFLPTVMDLNGMKALKQSDGHSLLPVVQGGTLPRESVFIQYDGNGSLGSAQRCIIKGDYKLIVDVFKDEQFIEVYDLKKDPQETMNLAFDRSYDEKTKLLIQELSSSMKKAGDRITLSDNLFIQFISKYKNGIQKSEKNQ